MSGSTSNSHEGKNKEDLLSEEFRRCIKEIRRMRNEVDNLRNEVKSLRMMKDKIGKVKQVTDNHRLMINALKAKIELHDKD